MSQLMTTAEVAEYLRVSDATLLMWIKTNRVPPSCYIKLGKGYRWRKEELDRYLMDGAVGSTPEPDAPQQMDMFEEEEPVIIRRAQQEDAPSVDDDY